MGPVHLGFKDFIDGQIGRELLLIFAFNAEYIITEVARPTAVAGFFQDDHAGAMFCRSYGSA